MPDDGSFAAKKAPSARATPGNAIQAWIRALSAVKILDQAPTVTLPALLDGLAETHGERTALLGEGRELSYRALGRGTGLRQGRGRCATDAELPGLCRDLARANARRLHRRADQHKSCRRRAVAQPAHCPRDRRYRRRRFRAGA